MRPSPPRITATAARSGSAVPAAESVGGDRRPASTARSMATGCLGPMRTASGRTQDCRWPGSSGPANRSGSDTRPPPRSHRPPAACRLRAIPVRRAPEQVMHELAVQVLRGVEAAFGLPKHVTRDRGIKPLPEEPLMRGGVVELDERLVPLFKLHRRLCERELVIIQPPLDVKVRFHEVLPAFPSPTGDRPMVDCQSLADGLKGIRRVGTTPIGHQVLRYSVLQAGRIE